MDPQAYITTRREQAAFKLRLAKVCAATNRMDKAESLKQEAELCMHNAKVAELYQQRRG